MSPFRAPPRRSGHDLSDAQANAMLCALAVVVAIACTLIGLETLPR